MIIDMHCHLDLYPDPFAIVKQCELRGINVLSVTTTPKAWHGTSRLVHENSKIKTALGFHPQLAHERHNELELFDSLLPDTNYIGEIGLDGSKGFKMHWDIQLKTFRHILHRIENAGGRIMSIHSRASAGAVLSELSKCSDIGIPILHWFSGSKTELTTAIDLGCWFSVGPAMLRGKRGQELVSSMPKDRILPETDGPFAKLDNQSLMPWNSVQVSPQIADLWHMHLHEVEARISENFETLIRYSAHSCENIR